MVLPTLYKIDFSGERSVESVKSYEQNRQLYAQISIISPLLGGLLSTLAG